jgi:hypothetical protein
MDGSIGSSSARPGPGQLWCGPLGGCSHLMNANRLAMSFDWFRPKVRCEGVASDRGTMNADINHEATVGRMAPTMNVGQGSPTRQDGRVRPG